MLVIMRRPREVLDFTLTQDMPKGTRMTLYVCAVDGNQVRLGITADKSILVDRHEVTERKAIYG